MNKKKLNKTVWYSSELDENKNPILPPIADSPTDLNGLHEGEIFLHNSDEDPSIWIRTSSGKIQRLKGTGENVSFWELMTDENGNKYIFTKYHLVTQLGLTMYSGEDGLNLPSIYDGLPIDGQTIYWEEDEDGNKVCIKAKIGGGTLGSLANVGEWADSVADVDRIMVQKKGSDTWKAMDMSEIGSASFENIFEGGDGNAYTSFVLSGDKKSITLMKGMKFATTDDLDKRINNLINGAPAAYDTLKEIADVLQGNVNSIGDIITTLGTKWTQDDTKIANWDAAFSWGDHSKAGYATKNYVDSTFVTIAGNEDVTGVHNFVNGLKIGGKLIDKPQDDVIYIDANLVVRGGITMYGDRDANIPSILNSIPTAGYDDIQARGLIAFNSNHFVINNGVVSVISGGAGLNEEQLNEYLKKNGYINSLDGYATEVWVLGKGYATQSSLDSLSNSVSTKWTQDNTKINNWDSAFSWGNHANAGYYLASSFTKENIKSTLGISDWALEITKPTYKTSEVAEYGNLYFTNERAVAALSDTLKDYITIKGNYNIEGIKNFIGTLQVNGSPIVYDKEKGYWYFTGDMIVSGGITMFGNPQGFEPSTIMDGVHVDGVTIIKENGRLVALGGGGSGGSELDTVAWGNVLGKPSWITDEKPECVNPFSLSWNGRETGSYNGSMGKSFYIPAKLSELTDDVVSGKYLPLTGGTVNGIIKVNEIQATDNWSMLAYKPTNMQGVSSTQWGAGASELQGVIRGKGSLIHYDGSGSYTIWDSGNDGSGSGLDADTLDGVHASNLYQINSEVDLGGRNSNHNTLIVRYSNTSATSNYPYNIVGGNQCIALNLHCGTKFAAQLVVGFGSNYLAYRNKDNSDTWSAWTKINAGFADKTYKLQTPRTIWGQTFDGTGNVSGNLTGVGSITATESIAIVSSNNSYIALSYNGDLTKSVGLFNGVLKPYDEANGLIDLGSTFSRWKCLYGQDLDIINKERYSIIKHIGINGGYALIAGYRENEYLRIDGYDSSNNYTSKLIQIDQNYYTNLLKANVGAGFEGDRKTEYTLGVYGQFGVIKDASMEIYSVNTGTYGYGTESIAIQTCFDNKIPSTSDYVINDERRCNLLLQPRGGQVYVGYAPTALQNAYSLSVGGGGLQILKNLSVHETSTFTGITTHNAGLLSTTGSFSDSVTINGIKINKSQDGTLYLDGNLVVKGGITMHGIDATNTPSILDSLPKASYGTDDVNKGIASFDGNYFRVTDGYVSLIADSVGLNEDRLEEYLSTWSGSSNITTLGVVTNGVWNGSKIANNYLANPSLTISGKSVSLGGSISQADLRSALGLGSNAYTSTQFVDLTSAQEITGDKYFTSGRLTLSSHLYRKIYDKNGNVYDHYYDTLSAEQENTYANLRVKSGSTFKTLRFGGDGIFAWSGNNVLDAANFNSYAPTLTGIGAKGDWNININGGIIPKAIASGDDLNNYLTNGRYHAFPSNVSKSLLNNPMSSQENGVILEVVTGTSGTLQILYGTFFGGLFTRRYANSGWSDWVEYLKVSDLLNKIKSVDGANSGLDADTLDGNHASRFIGLYTRNDIGTAPNYDNPSVNGLFELRPESGLPDATGVRPFNGNAPFFSIKSQNVMMQISGESVYEKGWWIRGRQSANVTLEGVAWQRLVIEDAQLREWNIKVKSAASATNATKAYQDGNGDVIINTYLNKNTGGTVNGIIKVNEIQATDNWSMLAYKPTNMQGVSSTQWGAGASELQGVIRSKGSLIHYDGSGSYTIWDSNNDGSGSGLDADMLDGLHSTSLMKFEDYTDYVRASFVSDTLAERASSKYIEFWYNNKWFNIQAGKIKAHSGFEGSLTGNADTATALSDSSSYTIFGNTFFVNGKPKSISSLSNGSWLKINNTGGTEMRLVGFNSSNQAFFGFDSRENNYDTYVDGGTLHLRSKNGYIDITSSGNVGVNKSPSYNFDVSGIIHATSDIMADGDMSADYMYANRFSINTSNYITTSGGYLSLNTASNELSISGTSNSNIHVNYRTAANGYAPSKWIWLAGSSGSYAAFSIGDLTVNGNILSTGGITMYSQRSLKNVVDERGLTLNELSVIKPTRYTWKDGRDNNIHIGGIADDIKQVLPEVVYKTNEGILTMDYGNAGFAIAASLIKPVVDHEEKIRQLQKRVSELEQELNRLRA
ncbi:MAG: tail fiber domain-containing protein [Bacteroidales bacterium]|nr:tail fiber domain-containing protein [Bacteroidales bacterium]